MIWLLTRIVVWPTRLLTGTAKAGAKTSAEGFRTGYKLGALLGYRRMVVLGVGIGVGVLVAPVPGREMRERLKAKIDELSGAAPTPGWDGSDGRTSTPPGATSSTASPADASPADASPADASPAAPATAAPATAAPPTAIRPPAGPASELAGPLADDPPSTAGAGAGAGAAEGSAAGVQEATGTTAVE